MSAPTELKGQTRKAFIANNHGTDRANEYVVEPGPLEWLVGMAYDAGIPKIDHTVNGSVAVALRWPDIVDWINGAELHDVHAGWRRDVVMLSQAHANATNAALELECEVPFQPE